MASALLAFDGDPIDWTVKFITLRLQCHLYIPAYLPVSDAGVPILTLPPRSIDSAGSDEPGGVQWLLADTQLS